jgi:hypothetical protein
LAALFLLVLRHAGGSWKGRSVHSDGHDVSAVSPENAPSSFLATIQQDHRNLKTLAVISILALLTISGAAYTDWLLTSDPQTTQSAD